MSQSAARAVRILTLLAGSSGPLGVAQIARALEIPKSTAYGILQSLVAESFVEVHDGTYHLGLKAFEVGSSYLRTIDNIVSTVSPQLKQLTQMLGMTSHYAILDLPDVVYLCKEDLPGPAVRLASSIGGRLPASRTAVGKATLAWHDPLPPLELIAPEQRDDPHFSDALMSELRDVRSNGYATDDGAIATSIQCVAAPVFDRSGCRGAVGVSYLTGHTAERERIVDAVVGTVARITTLLGGSSPDPGPSAPPLVTSTNSALYPPNE